VHALARQLIEDGRDLLPVAGPDGAVIGALERRAALDILLGDR
jgi:glycine betaine/proline transport system ATP-binding protein